MSEMLDILHYYFEDDIQPKWEQDIEAKSSSRSIIYQDMYEREYKYSIGNQEGRNSAWSTDPDLYEKPQDGSVKPYIPPSTEEELMGILGPPMG